MENAPWPPGLTRLAALAKKLQETETAGDYRKLQKTRGDCRRLEGTAGD